MVLCVALIDSSYTIFVKLPLYVSMNTQCSFNECSTCISTMQRRPGVITELVLAFFGRGFGNNTYSGAKNGKQ